MIKGSMLRIKMPTINAKPQMLNHEEAKVKLAIAKVNRHTNEEGKVNSHAKEEIILQHKFDGKSN